MTARIPTEDGNKMVQDPNFLRKLEEYINKVNADRIASFIVDVQSSEQIPVLSEPLFIKMGAHVELHPVMSLDDLKKGIPKAILEVNSYS